MYFNHLVNYPSNTIGTYSREKTASKRRTDTFFTNIVSNIRNHQQEYVYDPDQVEAIKSKFPNDRLTITESDGCFTISLQKGE